MCYFDGRDFTTITVPQDEPLVAYKIVMRDNSFNIFSPLMYTEWFGNMMTGNVHYGYGVYCFRSARDAELYRNLLASEIVVKLHIWGTIAQYDGANAGFRAEYAQIVQEML